MSQLEDTLYNQIKLIGLPLPKREFRFHPVRRFRFDFAYPDKMLAIEVEGGTWSRKGGHTSGVGFEKDCEKYNLAVLCGWKVLRYTNKKVNNGEAVTQIEEALKC